MIVIKNRTRLISVVLMCLIFFQSCRVYHKKNVSLEEAMVGQKRVKIKTNDGKKLKYKSIVLDSSQYYGVKVVKGISVRTLIDPSTIKWLRLHNKTMSIIYGVIIGFAIALVGSAILFFATWSVPIDLSGPIMVPM
jgi:hypothetical protein